MGVAWTHYALEQKPSSTTSLNVGSVIVGSTLCNRSQVVVTSAHTIKMLPAGNSNITKPQHEHQSKRIACLGSLNGRCRQGKKGYDISRITTWINGGCTIANFAKTTLVCQKINTQQCRPYATWLYYNIGAGLANQNRQCLVPKSVELQGHQ